MKKLTILIIALFSLSVIATDKKSDAEIMASITMDVYKDVPKKQIMFSPSLCADYNQAAKVLNKTEINCVTPRADVPRVKKTPSVSYINVGDIVNQVYNEYPELQELEERNDLMDDAIEKIRKDKKL